MTGPQDPDPGIEAVGRPLAAAGSGGRPPALPPEQATALAHLSPPDRVAACLVALATLPWFGPGALLGCHRQEGAEAAWDAVVAGRPARVGVLAAIVGRRGPEAVGALVRAAAEVDPVAELRRHRAEGRLVLVHGAEDYPARLAADPAPPAVLFATGRLELLHRPTVAVVGTRNATRPGRDLATALGADLVAAGVSVVSGLALGIDAAAHRGALAVEPGGAPPGAPPAGAVGVIASGLDIAYPRRHADLHRSVVERGLLLSETPLGQRPVAWRFPARNRVIAGVADAVVVVESRAAGGSMLTVAEALERGVPVLAVPGHPSSPVAAGTNELLFDGAAPVRDAEDVLRSLGIDPPATRRGPSRRRERRPPGQQAVLDAVGDAPATLAEVVARTGLGLDETAAHLTALEVDGAVARAGGWFERADPRPGTDQGGRR